MSETTVESRYGRLEKRAKEILREAGIPLNPLYHVREFLFPSERPLPPNLREQGWHQAEGCIWRDELPEGWWELGLPHSGKATPLQEILLRPYHPDSEPAMAARVLELMRTYREAVANGEADQASLIAADIGELHGRWNWIWEARSGIGVQVAASRGHEAVHGSREEKEARWSQYKEEVKEKIDRNPRLSLTEARRQVARDHGVSLKTVTTHTKDLAKK